MLPHCFGETTPIDIGISGSPKHTTIGIINHLIFSQPGSFRVISFTIFITHRLNVYSFSFIGHFFVFLVNYPCMFSPFLFHWNIGLFTINLYKLFTFWVFTNRTLSQYFQTFSPDFWNYLRSFNPILLVVLFSLSSLSHLRPLSYLLFSPTTKNVFYLNLMRSLT